MQLVLLIFISISQSNKSINFKVKYVIWLTVNTTKKNSLFRIIIEILKKLKAKDEISNDIIHSSQHCYGCISFGLLLASTSAHYCSVSDCDSHAEYFGPENRRAEEKMVDGIIYLRTFKFMSHLDQIFNNDKNLLNAKALLSTTWLHNEIRFSRASFYQRSGPKMRTSSQSQYKIFPPITFFHPIPFDQRFHYEILAPVVHRPLESHTIVKRDAFSPKLQYYYISPCDFS